ncbi:hypothetical protein QA584_24555 [Anaerocolumna sp. AGMB13025]|uniref:hypothetical protein n=1 Tax=Anaerocolumna sp. AGMB13025 TaxID=3039116 RepID=UPI00241CC789|nr:hypothetical protein [Anaerocolumna sp. AGMB13025]WFR56747.1 hypothetical protein QA584_24555 [Anaerocolumna sp. AGMB13025]
MRARKKAFYGTIVIIVGLLFTCIIAKAYSFFPLSSEKGDKPVQVYYIHNNPCESCREYLHFQQKFNSMAGREAVKGYHIQELNLLLESSKDIYDDLMKEFNIPVTDRITPMLIIGNQYLTGSETIENNMKELFLAQCGVQQNSRDAVTDNTADNGADNAEVNSSDDTADSAADNSSADTVDSAAVNSPDDTADSAADNSSADTVDSAAVNSPEDTADSVADNATYNTADNDSDPELDSQRIPGVKLLSTDSYLLYFSTSACESCEKVSEFIKSLPDTIVISKNGTTKTSKLVVEERSITDAGNLALYQKLLTKYKVPDRENVVPMVFYQEGYFSGKEAILTGLNNVLKDGKAVGFTETVTDITKKSGGFTLKDIPKILIAGFAGGLNPCSFSMLFLLLSLIAVKKNGVLKLGFIYLASKLIAYLVIAVSFYRILTVLESGVFRSMQDIIRIFLVAAAFCLGLLSLFDFMKARKEQYGKMLLKLPKKLQKADQNMMQKLISDSKKPLWIVVFVLGFIISAGEFLCTGQVYLATLLTMNYMDTTKGGFSYILILIFIIVMILPSFCIVILVHRGQRMHLISNFIVRRTDVIKLINVFIFFLMGLILLLNGVG